MHQMSAQNEQAGRKIDQENGLEVREDKVAEPGVFIDEGRDAYVEWNFSPQRHVRIGLYAAVCCSHKSALRIPATIIEETKKRLVSLNFSKRPTFTIYRQRALGWSDSSGCSRAPNCIGRHPSAGARFSPTSRPTPSRERQSRLWNCN